MKTIRCGVNCQYWTSPRYFHIVVDENETPEEVEKIALELALQEASFDFWIEEEVLTHEEDDEEDRKYDEDFIHFHPSDG